MPFDFDLKFGFTASPPSIYFEKQEERIKNYDLFKANGSRLLVATDLFGRGIDIERVNLVINYGKLTLI